MQTFSYHCTGTKLNIIMEPYFQSQILEKLALKIELSSTNERN